ncbi:MULTISPECIES: ABC transporter ATP-binding protein [Dickeya]|uniref:Glutathione import ATP-binding protein GsiA n=1 Tax=Dickeya aquatica TaxID=1401087 RepID=A0A375A921_9GAMM|nr:MULTISPECIES: ABC transporter ATP-binding protein [Dickeya]SLM62540.1 Putative glutathione transporter, ATP-binding component [Dickeya aquatica]
MSQPVLSVEHLHTAFRVKGQWCDVVRDLSFDIAARETLALVGESGCGKSVTALSIMRLLAGPEVHTRGRVCFNGIDLLGLNARAMQQIRGNAIGMVFQEPMTSLNPVMKIGQQITEVLQRHRGMDNRSARAHAVRLLEKVRIPAARARLDEYPMSFSGGMRQRVVIAIALACQPKLLIVDEPTTALDVTIQAQILGLLKALQQEEGMSMLFITHDMGVVAEMADRTLVMHQGERVELAATRQLFHAPEHPYSQSLFRALARLGDMSDSPLPRRFLLADAPAEAELENTVTPGEPVLAVRNLVKRFDVRRGWLQRVRGRIHAVESVAFSLQPGETLSLVGESGCGKSTTGRAILRLLEPTSGEVSLCGKNLLAADKAELGALRMRAQMIFQDPYESLNPRLAVGQAIAEPMIAHRLASPQQAPEKVAQLLESVGLRAEMAGRYPHQFSGGQRQRLCIARALALNPQLIIADEAVSALDMTVKAQIINLMLELQQQRGLAYLFISHDMAVVERISHRVAVMYQGEIVEIGPRQAVFNHPQHPYTRKLLAAVPVPDPKKRRHRSLLADELHSPLRPVDFTPSPRRYRQVAQGHLVLLP